MRDHIHDLRQKLNDDFEKHIPSIYIRQINHTKNATSSHFSELKGLHYLYSVFSFHHPSDYLSKSGIRIGAWSEAAMFCRNPNDEGTIENMLLFLEKQYFDCLSLLFSGSYRPIMIILRYMLELTTWAAVSILNKKKLTLNPIDLEKAMSHIQFEAFLVENTEKMQKLRSPNTLKEEKEFLKPIQSIQSIPEQYVRDIRFQEYKGNKAIKQFHSELSRYAHANIFRQLRWDGGDNETHIEDIGMFVGKLNLESYHLCLKYILKTHEIIFSIMLISSYVNIGFYQKNIANKLFSTMKEEVLFVKSNLDFKNVEKLLINPPNIEHHIIENIVKKSIINEGTNGDDYEDEDRYEDLDCPKCGYAWHDPDEECIMCHYLKYGRQESSDTTVF